MITDEHITKFQELYRIRFGREISRENARDQGTKLVRLMQIIYQPMTEEEQADALALRHSVEKLHE